MAESSKFLKLEFRRDVAKVSKKVKKGLEDWNVSANSKVENSMAILSNCLDNVCMVVDSAAPALDIEPNWEEVTDGLRTVEKRYEVQPAVYVWCLSRCRTVVLVMFVHFLFRSTFWAHFLVVVGSYYFG